MTRRTWRWLARAELAHHRSRYQGLVAVLSASAASLLLVVALVNGLEGAVGAELRATVASDARIAVNSTDFAAGSPFDAGPPSFALAGKGTLRPRLEAQVLFATGDDLEEWSAGLLVGVDLARDRAVESRMTQGALARSDRIAAENGTYMPLAIGESLAKRLRLEVGSTLNVTAGRIHTVDGNPRPIVEPAIVTGIYRTGLPVIDLYALYGPIARARFLVDVHPADDIATVLVVESDAPQEAVLAARGMGFSALTLSEFERDYLGPIFTGLRAISLLLATIAGAAVLLWITHAITLLILQDSRKIATLRAVGISAGTLRATYLGVSLAIGALGGALGLLAGGTLTAALNLASPHLPTLSGLPTRFLVSPLEAAATAGLAVATALFAGAGALWHTRRRELHEALRG